MHFVLLTFRDNLFTDSQSEILHNFIFNCGTPVLISSVSDVDAYLIDSFVAVFLATPLTP